MTGFKRTVSVGAIIEYNAKVSVTFCLACSPEVRAVAGKHGLTIEQGNDPGMRCPMCNSRLHEIVIKQATVQA